MMLLQATRYLSLLVFCLIYLGAENFMFEVQSVFAAEKKRRKARSRVVMCLRPSGKKVLVRKKRRGCRQKETRISAKNAQKFLSSPTKKGPQGKRGEQGPKGFQGSKGFSGDKGDSGSSSFSSPQSGEGYFGLSGGDYNSWTASGTVIDVTRFYAPLATPLSDSDVVVVLNDAIEEYCQGASFGCCVVDGEIVPQNCYDPEEISPQAQSRCTGNTENPTATPGTLCIYPSKINFAKNIVGRANDIFSFSLSWNVDSEPSEDVTVQSVWAYTAP